MSLTPKDWKSFQHYKERRPPWIKLHRTLLDNIEFQRLPLASRALAPMLWLLSAEYENGVITETDEDIAFRLRISLDDLNSALKPLLDRGFFTREQSASAVQATCKKTFAPKTETEGETETDSRSIEADRPESAQIDLEEAIAAAPARAPSRFDEFWRAYPPRDGPNPRSPAENKFKALVKSGVDPELLIGEAQKLASDEGKRGTIGTRFIPQAMTWLNQQRWSDHAAIAFLEDEPLAKMTMEQALQMFAKLGMWSRHAPCAAGPGEPGCLATVEQLAAVGLGPDGRKLEAVDVEQ